MPDWGSRAVGDAQVGGSQRFVTSVNWFLDSSARRFRECVVEGPKPTKKSCRAQRFGRDLEKASRWPGECGYSELFDESAHRSWTTECAEFRFVLSASREAIAGETGWPSYRRNCGATGGRHWPESGGSLGGQRQSHF